MTPKRYPIAGCRELRVIRSSGLVVVAVHGVDGRCSSGPLAIREDELDTLRSALADLAGETGSTEATPDEQASRGSDVSPPVGTSP